MMPNPLGHNSHLVGEVTNDEEWGRVVVGCERICGSVVEVVEGELSPNHHPSLICWWDAYVQVPYKDQGSILQLWTCSWMLPKIGIFSLRQFSKICNNCLQCMKFWENVHIGDKKWLKWFFSRFSQFLSKNWAKESFFIYPGHFEPEK